MSVHLPRATPAYGWVLVACGILAVCLSALLSFLAGPLVGMAVATLPLVLLAAAAALRYLDLRQFNWLLVIALPLHSFVMMILYGMLHLPAGLITALSTWKELLAIGVAAIFMLRALPHLARGRVRITLADSMAVLLIVWLVGRMAWSILDGSAVPLQAQIYGIRFYLIPLALYAIGRLAPLDALSRERLYWMLAILGGVTGALALIERMIPDGPFIALLRTIGYHHYYMDYVNAPAMWGPGETSASMWVAIGGRFIRRAGSIYMVSKPFAFTYLLIVPVICSLLWTERRIGARRWLWACALFSGLGLLISGTRAPIAIGIIVFLAMAFMLRRWNVWLLTIIGAMLLGAVLLSVPAVQNYIVSIADVSDSSTRQHLDGWVDGLSRPDMPWATGFGVGTANQEILRFKLDPLRYRLGVISESIYVQVFQELGVIGLLIYLWLQIALVMRSNRLIASGDPHLFRTGQIMRWATISMLLASFVAIPWQSSLVSTYFFWIIAGQSGYIRLDTPQTERPAQPGLAVGAARGAN